MILSPNDIIGSLIYRVNNALNDNTSFMEALKQYSFYNTVVKDGKFHLWHYSGTQEEISETFQFIGKDSMNGAKLKFPSILNFQSVFETNRAEYSTNIYNLAIVAPVIDKWTTQQRIDQTYRLVLKPIELEFVNQIQRFASIKSSMGGFPYSSAYIPTTGRALNSVMKIQYGDFIDAIEMPSLTLNILNICSRDAEVIIKESAKVADSFVKILK